MPDVRLRAMERRDWAEVADLIYVSINYWAVANGLAPLFHGGPETTELFCRVYEELDPGCCVVAEHARTGRLTGSCFYRERETHVSLGIMNVHPVYLGQGVGKALLEYICDFTDRLGKPLRLISSALNLESFSLYTRAGFVPRIAYQDMLLAVPEGGLGRPVAGLERVRAATHADVDAIAALELELSGISRAKDYRYFVSDASGLWRIVVIEQDGGAIGGYLASIGHPHLTILGPGVARSEAEGLALLAAQLDSFPGRTPLFLVPCEASSMVAQLYAWGARNCELHLGSVRGEYRPMTGVNFATFMPETG